MTCTYMRYGLTSIPVTSTILAAAKNASFRWMKHLAKALSRKSEDFIHNYHSPFHGLFVYFWDGPRVLRSSVTETIKLFLLLEVRRSQVVYIYEDYLFCCYLFQ